MAFTRSILKLHLQYRLLISEMNSDITILRILEDYLKEILLKKSESGIARNVKYFKNNFAQFRKENEDLRDKMHLKKMKLFALLKEKKVLDLKTYTSDNHQMILKLFKKYHKNFDKIKNEFSRFVEKRA